MPVSNEVVVAARRARLQEWIDLHYKGSKASFIAATGVNQGELSGLLKRKSFGEKRAATLEALAGMPSGYLVNPLPESRKPAPAGTAWVAYQCASARTRAAVDLLLLPEAERAAAIAGDSSLVAGVALIEENAAAALRKRKTA